MRWRDEASEAGRPYPRTTSLDFLRRCRPATADFYRYWDLKRRGRAMPARADIDPVEMKEWLPGVALIDVRRDSQSSHSGSPQPHSLHYRLIGTRPTKLRGREVTGMSVELGYFGASLEAALENYRLVIEEKTLVYDWDRTPASNGLAREAETLLLPLSGDGETVDMVLIYQETEGL